MSIASTPVGEIVSIPSRVSMAGRIRALAAAYGELTKFRLSALVLLTTAVGFFMSQPAGESMNWSRLLWTMMGTAFAAGCASALNQIIEINLDRRMHRTRSRPLPSGSMSVMHSFIAAMVMGIAGIWILAMKVGLAPAWMALATILIYALLYTPLKVRTTTNTLVGAICGALPPMIGCIAASGTLDRNAWILGALLFIWQLPHFFALAWLYREDYARGGYAMLPVVDRNGQVTCQVIVLTSLLLVPLALVATLLDVAGFVYAIGSVLLGVWLLALSLRLYVSRTDANARRVFLASIAYLPVLLCLLVIDRGPANATDINHGPHPTASPIFIAKPPASSLAQQTP
jgi:protoheme IX farnesyltransferase